MRILIIEDNLNKLKQIRSLLEKNIQTAKLMKHMHLTMV